jgi:hypothetical protein
MAFNPFHKFRKHKKVIFACLTIMCMLTFVACSGMSSGGDFAHWLQSLLWGKIRDTEVSELYGKKVTQRQMIETLRQREIANIYMASLTNVAVENRQQELKLSGSQKGLDAETLQLFQRMQGRPYFGGSLSPEGILDFKIWLHQAEQLGIPEFTQADVSNEIKRLTFWRPDSKKWTKQDSDRIEENLSRTDRFKPYFSSEFFLTALANEFRVRLAKEALLGVDPMRLAQTALFGPDPNTYLSMPAPVTPDEFWTFFKDNQTRVEVSLLPVKVDDYLDETKKGKPPTDQELKELYDKYKNMDYAPESKDPGFRQPRRIQVEWVSGRSDSDFYKKAAADYRILVQAALQVAAGARPPAPLSGLAPPIQLSMPLVIDATIPAGKRIFGQDISLWQEYQGMELDEIRRPSYLRNDYWKRNFSLPEYRAQRHLHDKNIQTPANVVAAFGQAFAAPDNAPVAACAALLGNVSLSEMEDRTLRGLSWLLAGAQPTALMTGTLGAYLTPESELLPLPVVRKKVEERMQKALAQDLLINNLKTVQKKVEELGKEKDKKPLQEYLDKAVKDYNLQTGKTTELRDEHKSKISDDPGLKPLKEVYFHPLPPNDPQGKGFSSLFFDDAKPYAIERFPGNRFRTPDDDIEWKSGPESFIYWKTEDQPAKTLPLSDPDVKKEVERAWRMQKARELAKKAAEALATEVTDKTKGDIKKLRDFAEEKKKQLIELPALAKYMQMQDVRGQVRYRYELPRVSEEKVPYAGPLQQGTGQDFANKLVTLKDKDKGATLVLADQPEGTYYVAVLVDKKEPSWDAFMEVYRLASDSVSRDPMLEIFEIEKREKYRQNVTQMLRDEATAKVSDEKRKIYAENMKNFEKAVFGGDSE